MDANKATMPTDRMTTSTTQMSTVAFPKVMPSPFPSSPGVFYPKIDAQYKSILVRVYTLLYQHIIQLSDCNSNENGGIFNEISHIKYGARIGQLDKVVFAKMKIKRSIQEASIHLIISWRLTMEKMRKLPWKMGYVIIQLS